MPRTFHAIPILLAIALAGCAAPASSPAPSGTEHPTGSMDGMSGMDGMNGTLMLMVMAEDTPPGTTPGKPFGWDPDTLFAHAGQDVEFVLMVDAGNNLMHDLVIDDLHVSIKGVSAGGEKHQTVTIDVPPGKYEYYCDVGVGPSSHRSLGMEGVLQIT